MNISLKAILLSAFVYPGAGHFILKKYVTGSIFFTFFSVILYFVVSDMLERVNLVIEQVKQGELPLDFAVLSEEISKSSFDMNAESPHVLLYLMIAVWVFAMWDAFRESKLITPPS